MPHQCTNCGHEFADGSQEMLSGCPECGGNKFQFKPARETGLRQDTEPATDSTETEDRNREYGEWPETAKRPAEKERGESADSTAASSQSEAPGAPSEWPSPEPGGSTEDESDSGPSATDDTSGSSEPSASSASSDPGASAGDAASEPAKPAETAEGYEENEAQASARTEMVSSDELPEHERSDRPADPTADPSSTDFERLREELNDQFESIRVVSPGTYELNLMELYDRQEYIISLREDGRYVIEMPGSWDSPDSE